MAVIAALLLVLLGCTAGGSEGGSKSIVRVPGDVDTIGAAVEKVAPGGLILVEPGTYEEEVTIGVADVTLRGTDRNKVIIDGGGVRDFGVIATADGVRVQNLTVHSALFYGVLFTSVVDEDGPLARGVPGYEELDPDKFPPLQRFAAESVTAYNNGAYGIYAFNAQHGTITDSYTSGSPDSGIYVGQCEDCDILVSGNVAERNAIGFENANASDSVAIIGNRFTGNRVGMTLNSNYQEAFTPQRSNIVGGNLIADNVGADSPAQAQGGFGIGVGINGGKDNLLVANRITGNALAGVVYSNTEDIAATDNEIRGGVLSGNGVDLVDVSVARAASSGNCVTDVELGTALPEAVSSPCPGPTITPGDRVLPSVDAPTGVSFLQVSAPQAQPSMPADDTVPEPLPDEVAMPDTSALTAPATDFLSERIGSQ